MPEKNDETAPIAEEPYSVFTGLHTSRKMVPRVSDLLWRAIQDFTHISYSPLSVNIYFPAIPTLAAAFNKSIELINLTVTLNMVFQGICRTTPLFAINRTYPPAAPMFWGTLSDTYGRRHMFILCLLLLALSCVGLALTPTKDYWLLLFLRCFQAAGSASTVAIGAGVIGAISTRAERGGFFGVYSIGPMLGPAIGPVLGGVLPDKLGWRAIFWFLCISSAICMIIMVLFLPETLRKIVGNGSIAPPAIYYPVVPIIGRHTAKSPAAEGVPAALAKKFQNPLLILLHVDIALLLIVNGVVYSVFYGVTASISTAPVGGGMVIGSLFCGKMLDWEYQRVRRSMPIAQQAGEKTMTDDAFPIEKARLRLMPPLLAVFVASCIGYGWCIDKKTNIAGPLVLLVGVGLVVIAIMNSIQTLMIDLMPAQGSATTACNNLVRCSLGAALVSAIAPLLDFAYLLFGGICALMLPVVYVVIRVGPRCRARRIRMAEAE
ncbi:major facilitator superfamily domain-containing protein [Mycena vulgaris]|nr:major facilitator superfamily domain-containing protein [Mycena vulgaris]